MANNNSRPIKNAVTQVQDKPGKDEFLIVGIGASAGGIQALQEFFRWVRVDSGMAYVVILHLSPDHDSQLAEVLQHETKIPVTQVTGRTQITADHIYVVPPNQHLTMEDGFIAVSPNLSMEDRRAPVDIFFRTLADEEGPRSIAVILSGTGPNGSMGLKRVKERGGACFVQNPREAEFNEMPRNAIATDLVDEVLSVADIPGKLLSYKISLGSFEIVKDAEKQPEDQQQALHDVFTQIKLKTGHDFSNYKRPTLLRRIERRINIHGLPDLPAFATFLQNDPDEPVALLKDLLISVTNFFRDKKPFDVIENEIVPMLFKGKTSADQVRIWVAGCATGEEAYSIAMLCAERTFGLTDAPKVQIFATDIDDSAIAHAREGLYTVSDTADVSPERLRRFFNREGDAFRIRREIREMIMFASHNFLKDPPFSHLDLVGCRNVMIYLNQVAQERVMETFHFALNPGGFLFLGTSESVDGASDLYASYNRENHIFQSRQVSARAYPIPESTPAVYFDKYKTDFSTQEQENKILERISFGDLHQQLLEQYAPPSLVVDEEYNILHLTERAGKYLQIGGGELSQNLLKLVKPELRLELRSILYQAIQRQSAVEARGLKVNIDDKTETVNIGVRPVLRSGDTAKGFILVIFEPTLDDSSREILLSSDEPVARQLEEELVRVKTQLRAANEQHDFQAEEMKASNEELQAMNEELRSAAEELETSKEELQSINEELRTVNQELKVKIEETSIASNNLHNLINSTDIGTIFLDRTLRVALYTPAASTIFNLIPADYGRSLTDITHKLEYHDLLADAEQVLGKLNAIDREVSTREGKTYWMRLTPYRTDEDRIKGVVITFVDITQRKKADEALVASEEKYRTLFNSIDEGFCIVEVSFDEDDNPNDYRFIEANKAFENQMGLANVFGKTVKEAAPGNEQYWFDLFGKFAKNREPARFENETNASDQYYEVYGFRTGRQSENRIAVLFNDITERKRREANLAFLAEVSENLVALTKVDESMNTIAAKIGEYFDASICALSTVSENDESITTAYAWSRDGTANTTGDYPISDIRSDDFARSSHAGETYVVSNAATDVRLTARKKRPQQPVAFISEPIVRNGKWYFNLSIADSKPRNWRADELDLLRELTNRMWIALERARAEEHLRKSEQRLQLMVNVPRVGVLTFDYEGRLIHANDAFVEMLGWERTEFDSHHFTWQDFTPPQHVEASLQILKQLRETKRGGPYEKEYRLRDGSLEWMMFVASDIGDGMIVEYVVNITERKQVEEALRKSEERLQLATTAANMGTFVYYVDEDRGEPDKQMLSLFGLPLTGELNLTTALNRIIHPDDRERYADEVAKATDPSGDGKLDSDIRIIHPDGSEHWINITAQTYFEGEPLHATKMPGVAIDITERKRTEEALRSSEERLRITMESAVNYAIITTTTEGAIIGWSRGAQTIFGYTADEVQGKPVDIIFTPEDRENQIPQKEMETAREQGSTPDERWHIRKDGSRFYVSGVLAVIPDTALSGYVKVARDMTEQKKAEEQLTLFEERNRVALQSAEMAAWDWNIKQDRIVWNEQHYLLFGLEPDNEEKDSAFFLKFVYVDDKEKIEQALKKAVEVSGIYKAEFRVQRQDNNEVHWMSGFGRAIEWENDKASRMVGVMFDITDRKKLEQQKEDFLSIASHELKTPVTSIMAYGELIQETLETGGDEQTISLIQKMNTQVSRLNALIGDLLDTTKISEGQLILTYESFDLTALISELTQELQPLTQKHTLTLACNDKMPVYADRKRIEQVITNLVSNAIKYSPDGGNVAVSCEVNGNEGKISVTDSGIGIPKDLQEKVFNRFFRIKHTRTNNYPGMGLGLYISEGIIRSHGGSMGVASNPGKGSVFYFTLPLPQKGDQS